MSAWMRKIRFDRFLVLLPGINWTSKEKDALMVNLKIARFFTRNFFHLLGYRSKQLDNTHLVVKNREAMSRYKEYKNENWYKKAFSAN